MKRLILAVVFGFTGVMLSSQSARANLQVFPLRAVLSEKEKTAQLTLRHVGDQPKSYRITSVFYRMDAKGAMTRVTDIKPDERSAVDFFRFSPRQVRLMPQIEQTVRLVLRKPSGLAPGEYRAHIYFEEAEESSSQVVTTEQDKATFQLKARVAVAVPVIVRVGETSVKTALGQPRLTTDADGKSVLVFELSQEGNGFSYGDFVAKIPATGGAPEKSIGLMLGVSSYLPKREVRFPLNEKFDGGLLRLEYSATQGEKSVSLATFEGQVTKSKP
jgi:hypothetical protein